MHVGQKSCSGNLAFKVALYIYVIKNATLKTLQDSCSRCRLAVVIESEH